MISRFIHCPSARHRGATKRIHRYICGTMDLKIDYHKVQDFNLVGYSNCDWAGSCDDRKNTSGYMLNSDSSAIV